LENFAVRIKFNDTDLPKKTAKRLKALLSGMPEDSGIPCLSLGQAQESVAYMLGYENWKELNQRSKPSVQPSKLDEELRAIYEVLYQHYETHGDRARFDRELGQLPDTHGRMMYQARRLSEYLGINESLAREITQYIQATRKKPKPSSSYSKNTYQDKMVVDDEGNEYLACSYYGSIRSELLVGYIDEECRIFNYCGGKYGRVMEALLPTTDACPEFLESYWRQQVSAGRAEDFGCYKHIRYLMRPHLEAIVPKKLFDENLKGHFNWRYMHNRALYRAALAYAVMSYAEEEYDESYKWFSFIVNRFPDICDYAEVFMEDMDLEEPEYDLHLYMYHDWRIA
jgi:hypothetical protein